VRNDDARIAICLNRVTSRRYDRERVAAHQLRLSPNAAQCSGYQLVQAIVRDLAPALLQILWAQSLVQPPARSGDRGEVTLVLRFGSQ
jgi:hypothetical protein